MSASTEGTTGHYKASRLIHIVQFLFISFTKLAERGELTSNHSSQYLLVDQLKISDTEYPVPNSALVRDARNQCWSRR